MLSGFCPAVLKYCSAVWCSAADIHFKLLECVVSGARFLTGGVFKCDIAHRRSVAVLCMLYKNRYNPMHPLYGAVPVLCCEVRVTHGALFAHWFTFSPPCCRTSQYCRNFFDLSVSPWNDHADPLVDVVGQAGFKSRAIAFLLVKAKSHNKAMLYWDWGIWTNRV